MRQLVAQMDSQVKKLDSATWPVVPIIPPPTYTNFSLDLPRGAKWMIRAADTPSLRVQTAPELEDAGLLLFVFGFLPEVLQC